MISTKNIKIMNHHAKAFVPGQCVSILTEAGVFVVVGIENHFLTVEDEEGFQRRVPRHLVVGRKLVESPVIVKDEPSRISAAKKVLGKKLTPSIDLHAEALGLSARQSKNLLQLQLSACQQFLNTCIKNRHTKCIVIHGVGDGTLRNAVRQMLSQKPGIKFHDGNLSPRGVGSTLIELRLQSVTQF